MSEILGDRELAEILGFPLDEWVLVWREDEALEDAFLLHPPTSTYPLIEDHCGSSHSPTGFVLVTNYAGRGAPPGRDRPGADPCTGATSSALVVAVDDSRYRSAAGGDGLQGRDRMVVHALGIAAVCHRLAVVDLLSIRPELMNPLPPRHTAVGFFRPPVEQHFLRCMVFTRLRYAV
jgi:hypothetical protein